ncbi:Lactoylglutathione lyase [bacterium HR40]|nr:Lactoylglutathione lyase [bacterium HR40]
MTVFELAHVNILASDLEAPVRFYRDVLGLTEGRRPAFASPAAWFDLGERAAIHLVHRSEAESGPTTGAIDHIAFACRDFDQVRRRLDAAGVPYEARMATGGGLRQIFLRDPNGVKVELAFCEPA